MDSRRHRAALIVLLASAAGCESVPEIRFVEEAGAPDVPERDGGGPDADGGGELICSGLAPAGGTCCNGVVWCVGECDPASCNDCAARGCAQGLLCCRKGGSVLCKEKCP
ncbi:MAG: hypothetical protein K0S65_4878 [Labilithrix sp.]|nr:hypothetical protein [Labilithrix sp.]